MSKPSRINRREFVIATSAPIVGAAITAKGEPEALTDAPPQAFRSTAGSVIPYSRSELLRQGLQRTFTGDHLSEIAFPIGGIGTGTVSLGGRGQLTDWEIFNRPAKRHRLPFTFVALWAREQGTQGAAATVNILEAPLNPPYSGSFGYAREAGQGVPHMKGARFTGAYPFARIDFDDETLPVEITLEAFNPFVPLSVDDSSLPVAVFHYRVTNRRSKPVDAAIAFSLFNAAGYDGKAPVGLRYASLGRNITKLRREKFDTNLEAVGLDMTSEKYAPDDPRYGSMCLLTTQKALTEHAAKDVTAKTEWGLGRWFDSYTNWLDEFTVHGGFQGADTSKPSEDGQSHVATLAPRLRLAPGESQTITFVLAWYFPVVENNWNREPEVRGDRMRNYYATRFSNAWDVGRHAVENLSRLESLARSFHQTFFSSSLPAHLLDAVSSQVSIIRTNTCLLFEGKQFYAFEGCADDIGCCPMNCTHVWNYEQALAFLFPELERSMRITDFKYNMREDGGMSFRTLVPVGQAQWAEKAAADGQMGTIMKLFREWQISGDDQFLRELWPQAKRALEYAWVMWDPDRDGVMEGEQHNTYDIEFYGPNTMMGTLYLGALKAGEKMAFAVGDKGAAETYRRTYESGRKKLEALWNGDYYIQKVPPRGEIRVSAKAHTQESRDEVSYQYGEGCLSDQMLGQWFAHVIGFGHLLEPERTRRTMASVYRNNFKHNFYDHPNPQRIYALNDEKGLLLCSWPKGNRPSLPFVYSDEVWTGIEYQVAAHLIYEGLIEEGLSVVKGVRDRYDGKRRNPWNEVECGSHYARAMSVWSVLLALSGYHYSAPERHLTFAPKLNANDFQCFFAAGTGWGSYRQQTDARSLTASLASSLTAKLDVIYGETRLQKLTLKDAGEWGNVTVASATGSDGRRLANCRARLDGDAISVELGEELTIPGGKSMTVNLLVTRARV
ncbi:MAG: GH116 family glycosyl-hydrolase [Pyrinomonadaceae bacterium]